MGNRPAAPVRRLCRPPCQDRPGLAQIAMAELMDRMRAFAQEDGALFFVVQTKSRGSVPIWADDIRATTNDAELLALILARTNP